MKKSIEIKRRRKVNIAVMAAEMKMTRIFISLALKKLVKSKVAEIVKLKIACINDELSDGLVIFGRR